jgi:3-oxoadipate enol-lactonase
MTSPHWRDLWRPGQIVDIGTVRLWYDEEGEGEPLLLLSGFGAGHHLFDFVWPELHEYRRITLEPRGLGKSDRPEPPYGLDVWADDTLRLLDELGIERAHIWATAFGSYYAIRLVANHPDRIGALITGDQVWFGDPTKRYVEMWKLDSAIMDMYGLSDQGLKLYASLFPMPDDQWFVDWLGATIRETRHSDRHEATVGYMHTQADVRADLPRIKVPTLLFEGSDQVLKGVISVDEENPSLALMKEAIPHLEIAMPDGSPFWIFAQKPRECASVVREFLQRHPLTSGSR